MKKFSVRTNRGPHVTVIVNPAAGAGTAGTKAGDVEQTLHLQGFEVSVVHTADAAQTQTMCASARPGDVIAPLGGDGMLSIAARGLLTSGATMLPLPAGRGNDFVRALGLPRDTLKVAGALRAALEDANARRRIDVGMVNGEAFLSVVSVGFDAETNARANSLTRWRNGWVYTAAGALTIAQLQKRRYRLVTDGRLDEITAWNIAVGNSGRHGGGQKVCPGAALDDGVLDVVWFGGSKAQQALAALLMRTGLHVQLPWVTSTRAHHVEIAELPSPQRPRPANAPTPVYADGDCVGTLPADIGIKPLALEVIVPQVR